VPWLTPVILTTQEAVISRIIVLKPVQTNETQSQKIPSQKRAGRVAEVVGIEFKPQYCKN
jgi:hypothetical protein